jgi:hypothetical protein
MRILFCGGFFSHRHLHQVSLHLCLPLYTLVYPHPLGTGQAGHEKKKKVSGETGQVVKCEGPVLLKAWDVGSTCPAPGRSQTGRIGGLALHPQDAGRVWQRESSEEGVIGKQGVGRCALLPELCSCLVPTWAQVAASPPGHSPRAPTRPVWHPWLLPRTAHVCTAARRRP